MLFSQARPDLGAVIGAMICSLIFVLVIGTLVGAVILRAACNIYNRLAGGYANRVPEPDFGKAMLITFVYFLVSAVANLLIGFALGTGQFAAARVGAPGAAANFDLVAQAISLPISFLVMAGMITMMLPTTFGKACLVTLIYILIVIVIVAIIMGVLLVVGMSMLAR